MTWNTDRPAHKMPVPLRMPDHGTKPVIGAMMLERWDQTVLDKTVAWAKRLAGIPDTDYIFRQVFDEPQAAHRVTVELWVKWKHIDSDTLIESGGEQIQLLDPNTVTYRKEGERKRGGFGDDDNETEEGGDVADSSAYNQTLTSDRQFSIGGRSTERIDF